MREKTVKARESERVFVCECMCVRACMHMYVHACASMHMCVCAGEQIYAAHVCLQ